LRKASKSAAEATRVTEMDPASVMLPLPASWTATVCDWPHPKTVKTKKQPRQNRRCISGTYCSRPPAWATKLDRTSPDSAPMVTSQVRPDS
jgi:hypothetical protein